VADALPKSGPKSSLKSGLKFGRALVDRRYARTAIRVSLVVGSVLLAINHGSAIAAGAMTRDRWISALLSYAVPYCVNTHGQLAAQQRLRDRPAPARPAKP